MSIITITLAEALNRLRNQEVTSVALTEAVLDRITAVDPLIQAYLTLDREGALRQAEQADVARKKSAAGPLCGIPLAVKDNFCTRSLPTTCGSKMLENFVAPYDATVVTKLRQAGAVLLGKLTMDEFAMGSTNENSAFTIPHNPWNRDFITGGSSGGSAAAVAADECFAALGSDTGGSIRQPASLCGVVGMKPTYGRVSRYGLVAFASSLDQVGPLTKDVRDCAILMNVISGHDPLDSTSQNRSVPDYTEALQEGLHGVTIGIPQEYFKSGLLNPDVEKVVQEGIAQLKEAGAELVEVSLPHTDYCVAAFYLIAPAEASSNLARFDGVRYGYRDCDATSLLEMYSRSRSGGFGDEVKRRILIGTHALSAGYYDAYYRKASQVRTLIREDFMKAFTRCDLLVSPVSPTPAWKLGEKINDPLALYLSDILTISANLSGIPAMSVPCGFSRDGLPIGLQLQASHFNEPVLFKAAFNLEQRAGVTGKKPVIV